MTFGTNRVTPYSGPGSGKTAGRKCVRLLEAGTQSYRTLTARIPAGSPGLFICEEGLQEEFPVGTGDEGRSLSAACDPFGGSTLGILGIIS